MGEVIVVTSGKGGVGKTTTTANLGAGLSGLDKIVVVVRLLRSCQGRTIRRQDWQL